MAGVEEELIEKVEYSPEQSARDSDILLLNSEFGKKADALEDDLRHTGIFNLYLSWWAL